MRAASDTALQNVARRSQLSLAVCAVGAGTVARVACCGRFEVVVGTIGHADKIEWPLLHTNQVMLCAAVYTFARFVACWSRAGVVCVQQWPTLWNEITSGLCA